MADLLAVPHAEWPLVAPALDPQHAGIARCSVDRHVQREAVGRDAAQLRE